MVDHSRPTTLDLPIIRELIWTPYRVPLPTSFTSAHERLATRTGVIVEVRTSAGTSGIGECAPLPEFSGGTLQDVLACLPAMPQRLQGLSLLDALGKLDQLHDMLPTAARCGLETAVLDALGQYYRCSLATLLALPDLTELPTTQALELASSQVRPTLPVNTVIGAQKLESAVVQARQAAVQGFSCVKLKVGPQLSQTVELIAAVRSALGPSIHLRLDANESWNFEQARAILSACERWSIQYVEQPLPRSDLAGMAALRRAVSVPIAADEALSDLESARRVLAEEAAEVFVIKPQLAGGLRQSQQMIRQATARGIQSVITSTIEAGVGVAAALQLAAAMPEITLECGLATLPLLADDLIQETLPIQNGHIAPPAAPGLGVHIDRAALAKYI
ncbi:o-succinylbenzoate synthase [Dictyobacter formicarum]|uniref:o-succinylbenzoate synthase n=1 Tax=Dictyobacter formicarum TaxID=2778368 RepID=A0ABQ3VP12_9CHLR|nr:o-succinylbenzoate synthase [Dictyobacter formicarum]GHO87323.1 chloromuconate cycloisomerase [Dictyobacter formicarum]